MTAPFPLEQPQASQHSTELERLSLIYEGHPAYGVNSSFPARKERAILPFCVRIVLRQSLTVPSILISTMSAVLALSVITAPVSMGQAKFAITRSA